MDNLITIKDQISVKVSMKNLTKETRVRNIMIGRMKVNQTR